MDFTNKTAVVTGGANGIGRCIADEFKKAGARVAIIDKDENAPSCDLFYHGDIADEKVLTDFVARVVEKFGKVNYLINNAMLSKKGILTGCSWEDFLYVQKVGVAAPYLLTKLLLPHFAENAAIVNICSTRAFMSQADTESYSAAKGGILSLTHALAVSLAGKVRVNAISPGWIDTTGSEWSREDRLQHPVGRVGNPLDIARMALYLCGEDSGFITGENITVDGGMTKLMIYHGDDGWKYMGE
jgi:NAD(P)-dependent dehydrogenase (short-subunit alcohol dehydrogenase family)